MAEGKGNDEWMKCGPAENVRSVSGVCEGVDEGAGDRAGA